MGKFDLENFPTSESAKKMLSYVSDGYYDESYVGKWIFQAMGIEYDKAQEIVVDLPAQFYPETATWGLMYHEIKWGLPVRQNLFYEERRRLIFQKRDYRAPMTPYRMEKYLTDATGFEVHIADASDPGEYGFIPPHPNVFKAYFLGEGTLDSKLVYEMLDRLKQSHTAYTVNDRTEVVFDNRNLEQIILRNIRFKIGISFWRCHLLDGSWLLDGVALLNSQRQYDLVLQLRNAWGLNPVVEIVKSHYISATCKLETEERILGFKQVCYLDCTELSDNETTVNLYYEMDYGREENWEGIVTIRRNLWYLDGYVSLNGSRILNAMKREESL